MSDILDDFFTINDMACPFCGNGNVSMNITSDGTDLMDTLFYCIDCFQIFPFKDAVLVKFG